MSEGNQTLVWLLYLLAAGVLFIAVWKLSGRLRPEAVRVALLALVACWLFWPAVADPAAITRWYAPAFIVMVFELRDGWSAVSRVLYPLLAVSAVIIPLALAGHWWWLRRVSRTASTGTTTVAPDQETP